MCVCVSICTRLYKVYHDCYSAQHILYMYLYLYCARNRKLQTMWSCSQARCPCYAEWWCITPTQAFGKAMRQLTTTTVASFAGTYRSSWESSICQVRGPVHGQRTAPYRGGYMGRFQARIWGGCSSTPPQPMLIILIGTTESTAGLFNGCSTSALSNPAYFS